MTCTLVGRFRTMDSTTAILNEKNKESLDRMQVILTDTFDRDKPGDIDFLKRKEIITNLNQSLQGVLDCGKRYPTIVPFGSFVFDVFTQKSDLHLTIIWDSKCKEIPIDKKIAVLKLYGRELEALEKRGVIHQVQKVLSAACSIIKFVDSKSGIDIDLSADGKDAVLRSEILRTLSKVDKRFPMLACLIKKWTKANGVNNTRKQTLSSFSLVLMTVFHLQNREPLILPPLKLLLKDGGGRYCTACYALPEDLVGYGKANTESLAELFITFFSMIASVDGKWQKLQVCPYDGSWTRSHFGGTPPFMNVGDFIGQRDENFAALVTQSAYVKIYETIRYTLKQFCDYFVNKISAPKLKMSLFGVSDLELLSMVKECEEAEKQRMGYNEMRLALFSKTVGESIEVNLPRFSLSSQISMLVDLHNQYVEDVFGVGNVSMKEFDCTDCIVHRTLIWTSETDEASPDEKLEKLKLYAVKLKALERDGAITILKEKFRGRSPTIKFVDQNTGIFVEVSSENKDGMRRSRTVRRLCDIDKRFSILLGMVQWWLDNSKLQMLSSISITSLVATHLQSRRPPLLPSGKHLVKGGSGSTLNIDGFDKQNKETVGELFVSFLSMMDMLEGLWGNGVFACPFEGSLMVKPSTTSPHCIHVNDFNGQMSIATMDQKRFNDFYCGIQQAKQYLSDFFKGEVNASNLIELLFGWFYDQRFSLS